MDQKTLAIELRNVTKNFGSHLAVHDVSLKVFKGEVFGFLGPNGAGKSTTIRMLLGQLNPHSGRIEIFGRNAVRERLSVHKNIGYLSGDMALDTQLTGMQFLQFIARLHGGVSKTAITSLAHRLDCDLGKKIGKLSRGNRQKVGLVAALMHDPDLLILDEPTSGFDPLIQSEFNKIILDYKKQGRTVFISSHILSEVQHLCDRVAFIREGKIIEVGDMDELAETTLKRVRLIVQSVADVHHVHAIAGVQNVVVDGAHVTFQFSGHVRDLITSLARLSVVDLQIEDVDLEELFMRYYRGGKK